MGEQKPLGRSPLRGNPSPESTYLPTYLNKALAGIKKQGVAFGQGGLCLGMFRVGKWAFPCC